MFGSQRVVCIILCSTSYIALLCIISPIYNVALSFLKYTFYPSFYVSLPIALISIIIVLLSLLLLVVVVVVVVVVVI